MAEPEQPEPAAESGPPGAAERQERGGKRGGKQRRKHSHPGGTGAVLGTYLARYSGAQGLSLLITNLLHYGSIAVVARMLGPSPLGSYALLFFFTALITQVIHMVTKPGTMRRTFGVSDDEDDVEEEDEEAEGEPLSDRPTYTLGVGLAWCTLLCLASIALVFAFRTELADWLLGDPGLADAVMFATITGAVWAIFKLAEMVIWFEGRALTYALIDSSRPAFNLVAIILLVSAGEGVEGAVLGQAIGTTLATVICIWLIRRSFQFGFSFGEVGQILRSGALRIPIASSMWMIQNADAFILSRFVDHKEIGLYNLASRTGFMVAFLPQGFRMALRPIRKGAIYTAYKKEYGQAIAQGQLLAYFILITLTAILAMVLGGEILIQIGGSAFESAAPIIPLTAAAMSMPALYRTISAMSAYPNKRPTFVVSTIFAALLYVGFALLLLGQTGIGIYAAPISMILAFLIPATYMFLRSQLGAKPIDFPYRAMLQATLIAAVIAVGYHFFHPETEFLQVPVIAVLMLAWLASLFLLRVIPQYHWHPIRHIAVSALKGSPLRLDVGAGLGALKPRDRRALRTAVVDRMSPHELVPAAGSGGDGDAAEQSVNVQPDSEGARLVRLLRRAGDRGGVPISRRSELDAGISLYLFSDQPVAVRLAKMRQLLREGSDAHELRTLADLRDALARAPAEAWAAKGARDGKRAEEGGRSGPPEVRVEGA
jgi:O-antigen/teichoic acid export membrane protein